MERERKKTSSVAWNVDDDQIDIIHHETKGQLGDDWYSIKSSSKLKTNGQLTLGMRLA